MFPVSFESIPSGLLMSQAGGRCCVQGGPCPPAAPLLAVKANSRAIPYLLKKTLGKSVIICGKVEGLAA